MGGLLISTAYQQLAAIARQRVGADNRQRAFSVALTVRTQVMPFNLAAKRVAQRFDMAGRTGVHAIR